MRAASNPSFSTDATAQSRVTAQGIPGVPQIDAYALPAVAWKAKPAALKKFGQISPFFSLSWVRDFARGGAACVA